MSLARELATDLRTSDRTIRRAVANGLIRARRPSARRLRIAPGEREYLRRHWSLLASLLRVLRSERGVRAAVLFGSAARGDDEAASDVDVLVSLRAGTPLALAALEERLSRATGRVVEVVRLAPDTDPVLIAQALHEGRVLVDRESEWKAIASARDDWERAARSAQTERRAAASEALRELIGG
jgi:predicted nucleotidyltransferase